MWLRTFAIVTGTVVCLANGTVPSTPDFSGHWEFVSGTTDRSRAGGPTATKSNTFSGVGFNCGADCIVVHKDNRLTISDAHLSGNLLSPVTPITLNLDGRPQSVADFFNPGNTIDAVSRFQDDKLVITTSSFGISFKQTLSLDHGELVLVTASPNWEAVLRYKKK